MAMTSNSSLSYQIGLIIRNAFTMNCIIDYLSYYDYHQYNPNNPHNNNNVIKVEQQPLLLLLLLSESLLSVSCIPQLNIINHNSINIV